MASAESLWCLLTAALPSWTPRAAVQQLAMTLPLLCLLLVTMVRLCWSGGFIMQLMLMLGSGLLPLLVVTGGQAGLCLALCIERNAQLPL